MAKANTNFTVPVGGAGVRNQDGPWEKRVLPSGMSDGDERHWPPQPPYRRSGHENYLRKLGTEWALRDGTAKPGVNYYLDRLPEGYGVFETDQQGGGQKYKRLFGHPSGLFYDSIVRFLPHFFWLLDGRQEPCKCIRCGNYKPDAPPKPRMRPDRSVPVQKSSLRPDRPSPVNTADGDESSRSASAGVATDRGRRATRGVQEAWPVDEEGTRNVYKDAVAEAYKARDSRYGVELDIEEEDSIDWLCERDAMQVNLTKIDQQHSFIPRLGELVLWTPTLAGNLFILREPSTSQYQCFDFEKKKFVGFPYWRAGVVTEVPSNASKNGPIDFPDLLDIPEKQTDLNMSGFRIETMVDPNDDRNKSVSKQYKYVPLKQIRPLSHWQVTLKGIAQKHLHASIMHALTCMTSLSLVDKYRFKGDWSNGGYFLARAVYLGSEMITVGDTIRLLPEASATQCTDVLVVDQIRLRVKGLEEQHLESEVPIICSEHFVTFVGKGYTSNISRALQDQDPNTSSRIYLPPELPNEDVKCNFRPVGTAEYGAWWPLHPDFAKMEVSYDQVLGRLYEAEAIRSWSGQRQNKFTEVERVTTMKPDLSFDMASIIAGRKYATSVDERIPDAPPGEIRWLISDTRAQSLTLAYVNGLETANYDPDRTPKTLQSYRLHIRVAHGKRITSDMLVGASHKTRAPPKYYFGEVSAAAVGEPGGKRRGRPVGSKLINGKIYTAAELAEQPHLLEVAAKAGNNAGTNETGQEVEIEDVEEAGDIDERKNVLGYPASSQTPIRSSQMAHAALVSTDEEDLQEDYEDETEDEDADTTEPTHRPLKSPSVAYSTGSTDDDLDKDETVADAPNASTWQKAHSPTPLHKPAQSLSKSQIMESVERGHGSAVASVAGHGAYISGDDYESEEEWDSQNIAQWSDPKNARGGTEETEGGDYMPESQ